MKTVHQSNAAPVQAAGANVAGAQTAGAKLGRLLARKTLAAAGIAGAWLVLAAGAPLAAGAGDAAQPSDLSDKSDKKTAGTAAGNSTAGSAGTAAAPQRLAPVVVVATRLPEPLADAAPSVSYIGAEQLGAAGNYGVTDVLRTLAGVTSLADANGNVGSVFIRGADAHLTLFTLDGRRLNAGFGTLDALQLGTDNLASVQIQRGAASAFFGANAAGGIVGLQSVDPFVFFAERDAADAAAGKPAGNFSRAAGGISGEGGSFGYVRGAVSAAGISAKSDLGELGFSLGGSWTKSDGFRPNSDSQFLNFLPRLDWRVNDKVTLNLVARYTDADYGIAGTRSTAYAYGPVTGDRRTSASLTDRGLASSVLVSPGARFKPSEDVEVQAFYSYARNDYFFDKGQAANFNRNTADTHEVSLSASWRINRVITVAGGYSFEKRYYDRAYPETGYDASWNTVATGRTLRFHEQLDVNSPWAQVTLTPVRDLTLTLAGRYSAFSDFKNAWTGDATARYRLAPTGTVLHARVANAYAIPTYDLFAYDAASDTVAAQRLKPEQSFSFEVGATQPFDVLEGASVAVTLFRSRYRDRIQWTAEYDAGYNVTGATGVNIDKSLAQGVELAGDIKPWKGVRLHANAALLDARYKSDSVGVWAGWKSGDRLLRRPDFTLTAGAEFEPVKALTLGFSATFTHGTEDVDATGMAPVRLDLKNFWYGRLHATYRFEISGAHFEVFGRVENLFNADYEVVYGYPSAPVTAYGGVRVRF